MSRLTKEQHFNNVLETARNEFDSIQSAIKNERMQCLEDRRFYSIAGAQWEGPLGEQFENKPKFEVNKIHLAVIRIINEYRNNRITVDFVSKDGKKADSLADTCDGLYRADEQDSTAEEAYDNAFEEAVAGGFGAWRLRAEYEDEEDDEDERQRIRIEPIFDADSSVFFDLDAKRQDKSDAKRCFVLSSMSRDAYRDEYGDDPSDWPKTITHTEFDWYTPNVVYIAEYYRVEEVSETIRVFETIDGEEEKYSDSDFEADENLEQSLAAIGTKEIRKKKVKRRKVHKYILSGGKVLEDCGYIAGKNIPIVPVYGKRWFVDNIERCMGHVRLAKDSQRLKNMQLSKLGEIAAFSSMDKPIFTPEQMAGHQVMWAEDNVKNYPYLLANPMTDMNGQPVANGPIGMKTAPNIPPAMVALMQVTEQDMADVLGRPENAEKMVSNISGKAVEMIQQRLDMQTFIYMSNMAKAIKRSGEIWLSMAKDIFVEEGRNIKAIGKQGEVSTVELMRPVIGETGETEFENDLSQANFDIAVDVGPSSSSKKAATVRAITGMMTITQDPETMQVLGSMAMMNMEGEGVSEVRDFFRQRLVNMGAVKPTEEEMQAMQAQAAQAQPDPQTQYMMAAANQADAEASKARADTVLTVAKAEETQAKTLKTMAEISEVDRKQAFEDLQLLGSAFQGQQPQEQQPGTPPLV
jgi:hypothetical protein